MIWCHASHALLYVSNHQVDWPHWFITTKIWWLSLVQYNYHGCNCCTCRQLLLSKQLVWYYHLNDEQLICRSHQSTLHQIFCFSPLYLQTLSLVHIWSCLWTQGFPLANICTQWDHFWTDAEFWSCGNHFYPPHHPWVWAFQWSNWDLKVGLLIFL